MNFPLSSQSFRNFIKILTLVLLLGLVFSIPAFARRAKSADQGNENYLKLFQGLEWRSIGPYRGGRAAAVSGVPGQSNLFYMGTTGGGLWRTRDGGNSWQPLSDDYPISGSIGAVAVSEWDNNVIYLGEGEKTVRGNVSSGFGIWRSDDAGQSWRHVGLRDTRHISRIRIHPRDPETVYAAALGDIYRPSRERGVFRSRDGGRSWKKVLFVNEDAGAVDLIMDPNNPRIIYASTWNLRRTPWSLSSGGPGSALWKSSDEGENWQEISSNPGFAPGILGIIGIAVSPVDSQRLYAMVEAEEGGVFRSDDGGRTWRRTNSDRNLRQRAWYYTRIYADPLELDKLYVLNVLYHVSRDGGRSFTAHSAPHGDHHDLWIDPLDNRRMVIADDGGAQVSFDGGKNWSTYLNQPTGQFYRVTTDNHFPYRIYGAQQDNTTVRILHRSGAGSIGERDWEVTAGSESGHLAPKPDDPEIVFGGNYGGYLSRLDHRNGQHRVVNVWPDNPMGHGAEGMKYRFQWNFPIFFSPHDPDLLYTASNHLHVSRDQGQSWRVISPDLTRNDPAKLGPSGGPITRDNTSVEYYCTIFAAAESALEKGVIWTGSDDGLLHLSRDGGENWQNVTPGELPEWIMINSIEPHPFIRGGAYVAATMYKWGDFRPYLYRTEDYGRSWHKITRGIPDQHFTRVLRADPARPGLLYAGTEYGMYISFNDGASWSPFQLNLPLTPITDLALKNGNLIAATQGRGFWLIDDLSPLHQAGPEQAGRPFHLFTPLDSYRMRGGSGRGRPQNAGQNHPGGVLIHFHLREVPDKMQISIHLPDGSPVNQVWPSPGRSAGSSSLRPGFNRLVWNMRYPDAEGFPGLILWGGGLQGPLAVPGKYLLRMQVGDEVQEREFTILADPRQQTRPEDFQAQLDFLLLLRDKLTETHRAIKQIRQLRGRIEELQGRLADREEHSDLVSRAAGLVSAMTEIEEKLYQTRNQSPQDPLNFPIRLNNKLAGLASQAGVGDFRPTEQAYEFSREIIQAIDLELAALKKIIAEDLPLLNEAIKKAGIPAISLHP